VATYFTSTEVNDLKLLPESMRGATAELANISAQAERDVIRTFTRRDSRYSLLGFPTLAVVVNSDLGLVVFLSGYTEDADDADVDADLKQSLKETIAEVVAWRFMRRNKDLGITSESTDIGKTVSWSKKASSRFPPDFAWRLSNFDLREPVWGF
jgi:hypothetical protein